MKEREIVVFFNPASRRKSVRQAEYLAERLGVETQALTFPINVNLLPASGKIIVAGGDGTVGAVVNAIYNRLPQKDNPSLLAVIDGGTHNGFYQSLQYEDHLITPEQLADSDTSSSLSFLPGDIKANQFVHAAALGQTAVDYYEFSELYRRKPFPRELKGILSALAVFASNPTLKEDPYFAQIFLTGPNIGPFFAVPNQNLDSESLTRVGIKAGETHGHTFFHLIALLFASKFHLEPLSQYVEIEQARSFEMPSEKQDSWINCDGEIIPISPSDTISIRRRTDHPIRAAGVIFDRKNN